MSVRRGPVAALCVFPVFVFERRREVESPDRILAGRLSLNIFGRRRPSHRQRLELAEIIHGLTEDAKAGRLPDIVVGWPGVGLKPLNAVDVTDGAAMSLWRARAFTTFVRVDAGGDQTVTFERAEVGAAG